MEFMDWIEIPRVDNIKFTRQAFDNIQNQIVSQTLDGTLCMTSHHLIFSPKSNLKDEEIWVNGKKLNGANRFRILFLFQILKDSTFND